MDTKERLDYMLKEQAELAHLLSLDILNHPAADQVVKRHIRLQEEVEMILSEEEEEYDYQFNKRDLCSILKYVEDLNAIERCKFNEILEEVSLIQKHPGGRVDE